MTAGYSHELYDTIASFGLRRAAPILDITSGTSVAGQPFAQNGFPVSVVDASDPAGAEALPFPNERFDLVISAQTFHRLDRARALSEAYRVLRHGGIVAIWWKDVMAHETVKELRDTVTLLMGKSVISSNLSGGFKEFYASQFSGQTLRVLPWRASFTPGEYLDYERSRLEVAQTLGSQAGEYLRKLESHVRERVDGANAQLSVAFIQYLYLARKT